MRISYKVLISDLDSSFLQEDARSFAAMVPALKELREREIPLVLCTSKTIEETVAIQERFGISDPFIVENGGAIYFRKGYFAATDSPCEKRGDYQRISLGLPYDETILYLALLKKLVPGPIKGFSDMSAEEIAEETGLSIEAAERAQQREYDEPFKVALHTSTILRQIEKILKGSELSVTKGGKYFHLTGSSNAGQAVVLLRKLYQERYGPVSLGGIGNGATDLLMLEKVDCPMIVAKIDGKQHQRPAQRLPQARKLHGVGPGGWTEAVSGMLEEWDQPHEG